LKAKKKSSKNGLINGISKKKVCRHKGFIIKTHKTNIHTQLSAVDCVCPVDYSLSLVSGVHAEQRKMEKNPRNY
jgi:hypothetical protein